MPEGGCCLRVARLCEDAQARLSSDVLRESVDRVRAELREPLRVAVAGRVKSGKSTLVNALLHEQVAPTAYGECTKVVTWFREGFPPSARLVFHRGEERRLPFAGGRLPETLGVDPTELERVDVELSNDALSAYTVIDTPGLASGNDQYSAATRRALAVGLGVRGRQDEDEVDLSLRTESAASQADALVFVFNGAVREDEVAVLDDFRTHLGGMRSSAVNTVAVLNQADKLGEEDEDPLEVAQREARRYAQQLGPRAAAVIPTVALLAETVEGGLLTEGDVTALRKIAALPVGEREALLMSAAWFVERPTEVIASDRHRLLERLGLYGIGRCLGWIDEGATTAGALRPKLRDASGIAQLHGLLTDLFARRADVLKAAQALEHLERVVGEARLDAPAEVAWLSGAVERIRLEPQMQALATTWAFAQVTARGIALPEHLEADLRRVALGATIEEKLDLLPGTEPLQIREVAAQRSGRWHAYSNSGIRREQQRIALLLRQQHDALWELAGSGETLAR